LPETSSPAVRPPAISLRRPWPWLIFHAGKDPENRTWSTTYRGDLLIHASGGWEDGAVAYAGKLYARGLDNIPLPSLSGNQDMHPRGIVGVAELYDICTAATDGRRCDCPPWAAAGHNHWRLRNAAAFPEPVASGGHLNLWQVDGDLWPAVQTQLKAVGRA
jgi:hypothetical protein